MPYNDYLASRIREALSKQKKVEEKSAFGGLSFMVGSAMCVGVMKDDLIARIAPDAYEAALKRKGCRPFDFTGRPMKGWIYVAADGVKSKKDLEYWIGLALAYNGEARTTKKGRT